jgi:hypothetical protein
MEKNKNELPNMTFTGDITIKGDMFNIHDNQTVNIRMEGQRNLKQEEYDFVNLEFFDPDTFNTSERQNYLRHILQDAMKKMNMESGMDCIAIYIAYLYYIEKLVNIKKYTSLFTDIEELLPESLPNVIENETGDKRYKRYTESLATETKKWFICDACLPPHELWLSNEFKYQVDNDRRKRIQGLVKTIYSGLKACDDL